MPTIAIPSFAGEVPRTTPRFLENTQASVAINCELERGHLEPLHAPENVARLPHSARTIYKHPQDGWLSWTKQVNVVKSAIHDVEGEEPLGQLYITGDRDYPTQYLAGGAVYRLGVPRPQKAPKVEIALGAKEGTVRCYAWGANDESRTLPRYGYENTVNEVEPYNVQIKATAISESQEDAENEGIITDSGWERSSIYCYTLIQSIAGGRIQQESAPSPPSEIIDVLDGDGVRVFDFDIPRLPGSNITAIRIYRTLSGYSSSEFHFLCELPLPVTEYIDTILDKDIDSEVLQTTTWDMIPDDAKGLIVTNNGVYAAFRGNEILLSEPNHAYAFPEDYRLTVEDHIVALGHTDNTIMVLTEGRPYLLIGTEPSQMQLTHLPIEQSCMAALSLGYVPDGLMYASPDGLMKFTANGQGLITSSTWTRRQWQGLKPARLLGTVLDDKYFGFFDGTNTGFIFTLGRQDIIRIELPEDMKVMAVYHHSLDDCIYLSVDMGGRHCVWKWEASEDTLEYRWRSKPFFLSRQYGMTALRIEGEQSTKNKANVKIFGPNENRPRQKLALMDTRTKRILPGRSEKLWSLELTGTVTIYDARLGTSVEGVEYGS